MDRRFKWISLSLALAATLTICQSNYAQEHGGGCASGDCNVSGSFGYPADGSCNSCDQGQRAWRHHGNLRQGFKAHVHNLLEYNQRGFDRNQAWPKPFNCADRQLYFAIWEPMLTTGYQCNCVFDSSHFDPQTHQLNQSGKSKIAGIFRNNPVGQKVALVQNSAPGEVVNARLLSVQSTIDQWYGAENFQQIAITNQFPSGFSGARVQTLNQKSMEETPAPIIAVGNSNGATNDTGVGQ